MGKYHDLAEKIVGNIGGQENINGLTHCITRLRFNLKDESKANDDNLKNVDGVVTVMKSGGQYQVIIGNHVPYVYEDVVEITGLSGQNSFSSDDEIQGVFNKFIDIISGCFQPFLGVLAAGGMLKGVNALLVFLRVYKSTGGTYLMLNAIGDTIFYFMPIFVGYTAAKKFKLNEFIGMGLGGALVYPTIQLSTLSFDKGQQVAPLMMLFEGTFMSSPVYTTVFGIPFIANNYANSVIPVIFIVWFASKVQKVAKKIVPELIQTFFVPFFVLLISLPVGFLLVGPVVTVLTNILAEAFVTLNSFSPLLMGLLVGLLWQVLVIFGLHWSLIPLGMVQLGTLGYSNALVGMFGASFSQAAVVSAMYFRLKDEKEKALAIPAIISSICGVTEPAIYGLSLPKKIPFIYSMIGGAVSGAVMTVLNAKSYAMGGLGVFGVVNYIDTQTNDASGMITAFISIAVAVVVGFSLTFFFWKDDTVLEEPGVNLNHASRKAKHEAISSPIKGEVKPLSQATDRAFGQGLLGKGVLVVPSEGLIKAPFDGTVMTLFPTKHAIGLISNEGMELLIHIGMDTVQLDGKHFEALVSQGDQVRKGQLLVSFDIEAIKKAGYSVETPIVITNSTDYLDIVESYGKEVTTEDTLLTTLV